MISIRNADEHDLPRMLEIYNEVIANTTAVYDYDPHTIEMRTNWFMAKQRDGYPIFLAIDEDGIAGFSSFGPFRAWAAYKYTVENSVYVAADRGGKGIGRQLMIPLIRAASAMGMHTMVAGVDASNDASIRLHLSLGFTEVAHFREVGYKFNRWLDLKFLQLHLPAAASSGEKSPSGT